MPGNGLKLPSKKQKDKGGGAKKYGRNKIKCARYRVRIGKPRQTGNKSGRNKSRPQGGSCRTLCTCSTVLCLSW